MTLQQLRLDFAEETRSVERLTSSMPPVTSSTIEKRGTHHDYYEIKDEMEPADAGGRNLSGALVSLIGQITHPHDPANCEDCRRNPLLNEQRTAYPPRFPLRRALADWEKTCRRRHRLPTWTDHASGPICSSMLRSMVEGGASLRWAADNAGVSYPRAERLVSAAERFVLLRLVHWEHERNEITLDPDCEMCRTRRSPAFHEDAA